MINIVDQLGKLEPDCPFCAIITGEQNPPALVNRWPDAIAFAPLRPATRGHTLVIPTEHYENMWDLDERYSASLLTRIQSVARAMRETLPLAGLNLISSTGAVATQTVPHIHFHVLPRYLGDNMEIDWPDASCCTDEEIDRVAKLIRGGLLEQ